MDQVDASATAIGLLFNSAKILAEQQTNMKIETVHFVDGWVHLNMLEDLEVEEDTTVQNLVQHALAW